MRNRTREELYRDFLEFVGSDIQQERIKVNRKMLSVLLWCFVAPVVAVIVMGLLVQFEFLPRNYRAYAGWLTLLFPVGYSLYVLGSEVLVELPRALRRGGMASTLEQAMRESEWRARVCEALRQRISARPADWGWIISNFRIDLDQVRHRTRYLTVLAGAIFFLLIRGLEWIGDGEQPATFVKHPVLGWVDASDGEFVQILGLGLFLVLFYLSGMQTHHLLRRYLGCTELISGKVEQEEAAT